MHAFLILGHWLGNQSSPIFTVIDTPGFGNDLIEEERTIEGTFSEISCYF